MLKIYDLEAEHLETPIGIDAEKPRFSWKLSSTEKDVYQLSYQILVAKDSLFTEIVWDSGIIDASDSINILYDGEPLQSRVRYFWKVAVTTNEGSAESDTTYFEMDLLNSSDWQANWVTPFSIVEDPDEYQPISYLRKKFTIEKEIKKARIYQTAHGLYEFWINGKTGTPDVFKPGFTSYYKRLQYQAYDITNLIEKGDNVWAVALGDGWWRGMVGGLYRNSFGYSLQFLGQIEIEYLDGSIQIISTDNTFLTDQGPLRMSDMQFGDIYDARLEKGDWLASDFNDSDWAKVEEVEDDHTDKRALIATRSVGVREKEVFTPEIITDANGDIVLDFGQNIAGYVSMKVRDTKRGQKISLIHGEDMKDGAFDLTHITSSPTFKTTEHYQQIDYIAKGSDLETYKPMFAVFGFRYAKLVGYDIEKIQPEDFLAIAVYSDMAETGDFTCSNPLINQLVKNSRWSQKGNFLDVPTDCPTRERSTWTGDSQVYAKTSTLFTNVYTFFEKWLLDLDAEQYESGMVGCTVPSTNTTLHNPAEVERLYSENKLAVIPPGISGPDETKPGLFDGSTGWGDTAVITPYTMYLCYGDQTILENQYESAKKWVDFMIKRSKEENKNRLDKPEYHQFENGVRDADYIYDTGFHYGEWLEPESEEAGATEEFDAEKEKNRTNSLVATAYLFYSSHLLSKIAGILNNPEDQEYYSRYSEKVKQIYNKYYIQEDGTMVPGKQAPYVRVLQFNLVNDDKRKMVAEKLVEEIRNNGMKLNTGFLSTPFLLFQLLENGFKDEAFAVLEQTESPSWLAPVILGATTILEDWTGLEEHANSYNHYSYGAVCDFLFSAVAGIRPFLKSPGYKDFEIKPTIGGTLTNAKAELDSPYGKITSEWVQEEHQTRFSFEIPVNTTAVIKLPNGDTKTVGSGIYNYVLNNDDLVEKVVEFSQSN